MMRKVTLYLFIALMAVVMAAGYYWGFERCEDQLAYDYSPYCLRCNERIAENGDAGAAYNLALFFEGRNASSSDNWFRVAAQRGDRRAVARALTECGDLRLFSSSEAEVILTDAIKKDPKSLALDAMYFYLGKSCGPVNMDKVRYFYLNVDDDDIMLCSVALKYAKATIEKVLASSDRSNSIELLQRCLSKTDPDSETYRGASKVLNSLEVIMQK